MFLFIFVQLRLHHNPLPQSIKHLNQNINTPGTLGEQCAV